MEYLWSAESDRPAGDSLMRVAPKVDLFIKAQINEGVFSRCPIKIRYVPIIMPPELQDRYPARSRVRRKENVYSCCPQLDYDLFVGGTFNDILAVFLGGLDEVPSGLHKLGAPHEVIFAFEELLDRCFYECSNPTSIDRHSKGICLH
jgi:hypothetical protein